MASALSDRGKPLVFGVGRLREGITLMQAQANLQNIASVLGAEYPHINSEHSVAVRPIADVQFSGGSRMLWFAGIVLACVAGIVLLIACSNAANLVLARAAARHHEVAVRLALGASRPRVVRQLLTESLCFGLMGGVVGLVAAAAAKQLLATTLPATSAFAISTMPTTVLLFAFASSVLAGVTFGTIPALSAVRGGVAGILNGSRTLGGNPRRVLLANALLVGQVALSFLLLTTAALFVRSIQRAYEIDPGFEPSRLAVFITTPGQAGYTDAQVRTFYTQVRERVRTIPGVASVSWASNMPLFARPLAGLRVEGRSRDTSSDAATAIVNTIGPGYFSTAAIPTVKPEQVINVVRREINDVGPQVLVAGVRTGQQVIDGSLFQPRMAVILVATFGIIALILACIGLYGILAFAVEERRREIGVRMALGASKGSVLKLILKQGMTLVAAGLLIGVTTALMTGRAVRAMLHDVAPTDPLSFVVATVLLCGVALAACYLPARRATDVDPLNALRRE